MSRLVLIDRDGTINVERHYLSSPEQVELLPGAVEGLKLLRSLDLRIAVITNQSGIGRGYFDLEKLEQIHGRLKAILNESDTAIDAVYFCPHLPEDNCQCRKPLTKMALQAAEDFQANLSDSFVIGDKACDIELGKNIGATTILVRTGYGDQAAQEGEIRPDHIVENLSEAARMIEKLLNRPSTARHI